GIASATKDPAKLSRFSVTRYELMSLNGKQPQVGRLARRGAVLSLVQNERTLRIAAKKGMTARLERVVGCKVWVLGDIDESTIKVFKYGRITCEKPAPIKAKKEKSR
ncbi:MAG: hypothetical protein JRH20_27165, partial [Deltaproteobacteria bacterium]|nr:hypothetical protein [Deltaproteobacteria bacterium]